MRAKQGGKRANCEEYEMFNVGAFSDWDVTFVKNNAAFLEPGGMVEVTMNEDDYVTERVRGKSGEFEWQHADLTGQSRSLIEDTPDSTQNGKFQYPTRFRDALWSLEYSEDPKGQAIPTRGSVHASLERKVKYKNFRAFIKDHCQKDKSCKANLEKCVVKEEKTDAKCDEKQNDCTGDYKKGTFSHCQQMTGNLESVWSNYVKGTGKQTRTTVIYGGAGLADAVGHDQLVDMNPKTTIPSFQYTWLMGTKKNNLISSWNARGADINEFLKSIIGPALCGGDQATGAAIVNTQKLVVLSGPGPVHVPGTYYTDGTNTGIALMGFEVTDDRDAWKWKLVLPYNQPSGEEATQLFVNPLSCKHRSTAMMEPTQVVFASEWIFEDNDASKEPSMRQFAYHVRWGKLGKDVKVIHDGTCLAFANPA